MNKFILLMPLVILTACASSVGSSSEAHGIKIALEKNVQDCEFLGDVHGVSGLYGVFAASALKGSRTAAIKLANELGATHIVWGDTTTTYGSTSTSGNAYQCEEE